MRLPLADQAWFYAMLPAEGVSVGDIRGELSSQTIDNLLSVMKSVTITGVSHDPVAVAVPKMDVTTELDLSGVYQYFKLPLKGFARMDSAMRPSAVRQRVRLRVDEQGLDPAPLDVKPESEVVRAVENTQRFILNRPFLFFVYHEPTGMIPVAGQFTGM
jgi:serine protease inhibitor